MLASNPGSWLQMHQQLVTECQALATNLNHSEFKVWLIRLIIATLLSQSLLINALSQLIFPAVLWRMDLWPLFYQELEWGYLPATKDSDAGKDWGKEEKQATEDEVSLTQRTWIWANSGRWWRTGKPDVLHSMGSQRVRHKLVTE